MRPILYNWPMALSCVILSKNEEKNVARCLDSLYFCDEKIVIDDNSDDQTERIAKKHGANICKRDLEKDFSAQRNFGLSKAKNEWILFVDADEVVSNELAAEIKEKTNENKANGIFIKREDFIWGKKLKYGESSKIYLLRLAKKGTGKWEGKVHEVWNIEGETTCLKNPLLHYPHQSVEEFLTEMNLYTDIRAKELFENHIRVNVFDIILYPRVKFFQNFFLRLGFLDGIGGLIFALIMSFHSYLVRAKLWQLLDKN